MDSKKIWGSMMEAHAFAQKIEKMYGNVGREWLATLPERISRCAATWGLVVGEPCERLSYHYVVHATCSADGKLVILKCGVDRAALVREAALLGWYGGTGVVKVLAYDENEGAVLLEAITPGKSLESSFPGTEQQAREAIVPLVRTLHSVPVPESAPLDTVAELFMALERPVANKISDAVRVDASKRARWLVSTQEQEVLLHGDLHQGNILWSEERGWVAIDPKGIVGEPLYEYGAFLRNPRVQLLGVADPVAFLSERIAYLARAIPCNPVRLKEWGYVQAVLAACWRVEEDDTPDGFLQIAEYINAVKI